MKIVDLVRFSLAGLLVYVALNGMPQGVEIPKDYEGPLKKVHAASRSMDSVDRQGLSEALEAASTMLDDDKANLLVTTEDLQEFIKGTIAYGYTSFSIKKYPEVSTEIQKELESSVGSKVSKLESDVKQDVVNKLAELSRAVK